jgi:hypothetical protein
MPDTGYFSVVAFLAGMDIAGERFLSDFRIWLSENQGCPGNLTFWAQIAIITIYRDDIDSLTDEEDQQLVKNLLDLLDAFFENDERQEQTGMQSTH